MSLETAPGPRAPLAQQRDTGDGQWFYRAMRSLLPQSYGHWIDDVLQREPAAFNTTPSSPRLFILSELVGIASLGVVVSSGSQWTTEKLLHKGRVLPGVYCSSTAPEWSPLAAVMRCGRCETRLVLVVGYCIRMMRCKFSII